MKVLVILVLIWIGEGRSNHNSRRSQLNNDGYYLDENLRDILREITYEENQEVIQDVTKWLEKTDEVSRKWQMQLAHKEWDYETNVTDENAQKSTDANVAYQAWALEIVREARDYKEAMEIFPPDIARKIRLYSTYSSPSNPEDVARLKEIGNELQAIYAKATVKDTEGNENDIEPELTNIMATSRDWDKLLWAWKGWRDATGPKMKKLYEEFVLLLNKGAKENNYADMGAAWRDSLFDKTPNLEAMCEKLWVEIRPLYQKVHAYVRKKLINQYPDYDILPTGGIPAHLLGNMWAQEWDGIYDIVKPYPNIDEGDVSNAMKEQKYTVDRMFRLAEEFYTSIGLESMTPDFWENSMMVKPPDRDVVCHASAFDFYNDREFRIKMCTDINEDNLETIHHEMGHIEYFMAYRKQPCIYRDGANCAFHEAIGDTIALSVRTEKHLKAIKLLPEDRRRSTEEEKQRNINFLMKKALYKIAFLPFGYMIDKWRWDVFRGKINPETYNEKWWKMRYKYQGLVSPVHRTEDDFDPGAKFHIPANSPYICYFISFISQFQFYEALCDASGHKGDLHKCDYYQSKSAGKLLKDMLRLGKERPWSEAMKILTGQTHVKTSSIKEYFRPLETWLDSQNLDVGWDNDD